jgi:uncharacterized protein YqgQ
MTNYTTFTKKIRAANTLSDIERLDTSLTRLYDAGIFTPNEFGRLDLLILVRSIEIEEE